MTTDLPTLAAAADAACSAMHAALVEDVAARLTCPEAEALAALYRVLGYDDLADDILDAHASSDDEPADLHHAAWLHQQAEAASCTCRTDVPQGPGSLGLLTRIAGCPVHDAWANAQ